MQTLSYMRRNSTHHHPLVPYALFIGAIIYESLASMTLYMSPLLGLSFYYIIQHIHDERKTQAFIMIALYTLYVEIDRGMILLSFVLFTFIFYKLLFKPFKLYVHCQICLIVSYVTVGYLGYFLFNLFLAYLFNLSLPHFGIEYLYFILTDIFILLVFA